MTEHLEQGGSAEMEALPREIGESGMSETAVQVGLESFEEKVFATCA